MGPRNLARFTMAPLFYVTAKDCSEDFLKNLSLWSASKALPVFHLLDRFYTRTSSSPDEAGVIRAPCPLVSVRPFRRRWEEVSHVPNRLLS